MCTHTEFETEAVVNIMCQEIMPDRCMFRICKLIISQATTASACAGFVLMGVILLYASCLFTVLLRGLCKCLKNKFDTCTAKRSLVRLGFEYSC